MGIQLLGHQKRNACYISPETTAPWRSGIPFFVMQVGTLSVLGLRTLGGLWGWGACFGEFSCSSAKSWHCSIIGRPLCMVVVGEELDCWLSLYCYSLEPSPCVPAPSAPASCSFPWQSHPVAPSTPHSAQSRRPRDLFLFNYKR